MSSAAARVGDPISHTSALDGLLAGLAIGAGAALVGIAIVGTGGLAAVAVVGAAASAGAGVGQVFGSMNTSEAGSITSGSPNVRINGIPAARAHVDFADCSKHSHKEVIATGSGGVRINGFPAARVDDKTACDGTVSSGSSNVRIGGGTVQTDEINPEVPAWLEWTVAGVGLASAFALASPAIVIAGLAGGLAGGAGGHWLGGELFGEGSDGQKLMALGGAFLGGAAGARMAAGPKPLSSILEQNRISQARQRQYKMLQDNEGYNISPTSWDRYPTIGRQGTFVSDKKSMGGLLSQKPIDGKVSIPKSQARIIEQEMGLEPNSLANGFKVRKITGVKDMYPRSPLEGNDYFLGPGKHLPGGHPEMVIESVPTKDNAAVKTLFEVIVND